MSQEFAVRVVGDIRSNDYEIIPRRRDDFEGRAWTGTPEHDWLSPSELENWGVLIRAFDEDPLPVASKLARALWYFEYAARTHFIDVRWTFLSTVVETLLSTGDSTRHFTKRLPLLAKEVGVTLTNQDASNLWRLRSAIVHGGKHGGLTPGDGALYQLMEDVLRETLKRAILDIEFRSIFFDRQRINEAFDIAPSPPRTITCPHCKGAIEGK